MVLRDIPKLIDEPTGALNRKNSEEVLDLLTSLNQEGQSILMVTHDVKAAIRGTRIFYLEDGKILDEMPLPPFDVETAKEREEKVSTELVCRRWGWEHSPIICKRAADIRLDLTGHAVLSFN